MTAKKKKARRPVEPVAITPVEYGGLQQAYDYFNKALFNGGLIDVFIVYQRRAHSRGYFAPDRFSARVGKFGRHELALNPDNFIGRTDKEICSTLVHEQCHVLRHQIKGKTSAYHDREWAALMKQVGLHPSTTGKPGGAETGWKVTHYIVPRGPFAVAFAKLAASGWKLNLESVPRKKTNGGGKNKDTFSCTSCGQKVWGKPNTAVDCRHCGTAMQLSSSF